MRKAEKFPRTAFSFRLNENEYNLVTLISDKYKCKTFSECIRFLILREADQILSDQAEQIQSGRKLTSW